MAYRGSLLRKMDNRGSLLRKLDNRRLILSREARRKVDKIFYHFDRNTDGGLNRYEMAALVIAVNPQAKLSEDKISATLDAVFQTYGQYVDGVRGLSLDGLVRSYEDGTGNVDRDFEALDLDLEDEGPETVDPKHRRRLQKVEKMFQHFDRNWDGGLNRYELAALIIAVNPLVKFSEAQISIILDEVFLTYGEYIVGDKGLSLDGLVKTYEDGAGDADKDFEALGLVLETDGDDEHKTFEGAAVEEGSRDEAMSQETASAALRRTMSAMVTSSNPPRRTTSQIVNAPYRSISMQVGNRFTAPRDLKSISQAATFTAAPRRSISQVAISPTALTSQVVTDSQINRQSTPQGESSSTSPRRLSRQNSICPC